MPEDEVQEDYMDFLEKFPTRVKRYQQSRTMPKGFAKIFDKELHRIDRGCNFVSVMYGIHNFLEEKGCVGGLLGMMPGNINGYDLKNYGDCYKSLLEEGYRERTAREIANANLLRDIINNSRECENHELRVSKKWIEGFKDKRYAGQ